VNLDQRSANGLHGLHAHRLVVDEGAGAAVRKLHAAQNQLVLGWNAVLIDQRANRMVIREIECRRHLALLGTMPNQGDVAARAPSEYLPLLAYDSITHSAKSLRFLADLVGIERLMLGTDYSFPPADLDPLASLRAAGFASGQAQAIAYDNVRRIFPRIAC